MNRSRVTTNVREIRRWAEARGGTPSVVSGTGRKRGDIGIIRIDFPGYSGAGKLKPVSWDEWGEKFEESNLAMIFQDKTAKGQKSNFNKLVARDTVEDDGKGSAKSGGRGRRTSSAKRSTAQRRSVKRSRTSSTSKPRGGAKGASKRRKPATRTSRSARSRSR